MTPLRGGGVVVTGSMGEYDSEDAIVGSHGSSGVRRWTHVWSSSGAADDEGVDAAVTSGTTARGGPSTQVTFGAPQCGRSRSTVERA